MCKSSPHLSKALVTFASLAGRAILPGPRLLRGSDQEYCSPTGASTPVEVS